MLEQEEKRSLHKMLLVSFLKVTGLTFNFFKRSVKLFQSDSLNLYLENFQGATGF